MPAEMERHDVEVGEPRADTLVEIDCRCLKRVVGEAGEDLEAVVAAQELPLRHVEEAEDVSVDVEREVEADAVLVTIAQRIRLVAHVERGDDIHARWGLASGQQAEVAFGVVATELRLDLGRSREQGSDREADEKNAS